MKTNVKIALGYVRVSSQSQANEGVSLDAQRAKLQAWATLNGYELAAIHEDAGISGKDSANRPGLLSAIDDACRRRVPLVVLSLSRFARNTRQCIELAERLDRAGADLVSLSERIDTTSAAGKMVFRLMAILAEFERDQLVDRTVQAMAWMRSQNKRIGEVPFGRRLAPDGTTLLLDAREQRAIEVMVRLREKSKWTYQRIADRLNKEGVKPKRGKAWRTSNVACVITRTVREAGAA